MTPAQVQRAIVTDRAEAGTLIGLVAKAAHRNNRFAQCYASRQLLAAAQIRRLCESPADLSGYGFSCRKSIARLRVLRLSGANRWG